MKKNSAFTILFLVFIVSACSLPEKTTTYQLDDGINTTITFKHKGDKVTRDTETTIIPYAEAGFSSKQEAQENLAYIIEEYKNINGLQHRIDYTDTEATEVLTVNYLAVDINEIADLIGVEANEDGDIHSISLKKTIKLLESEGFKKVE